MKFLSRILFVVFVLLGVLVAVSNRQPVELGLWPLPHVVVTPLYLVIVAVLLAEGYRRMSKSLIMGE